MSIPSIIFGANVSTPQTWYVNMFAEPRANYFERTLFFDIRLVTGLQHIPYEEGLLLLGLHAL